MKQARQNADILDNLVGGIEVGADLHVEEPGEEEGSADKGDELLDLACADGDEALVAAVMAVLLLEDDAGDAAGLALLGGEPGAGVGAWDGEDSLRILRIGFGEVVEVGQGSF